MTLLPVGGTMCGIDPEGIVIRLVYGMLTDQTGASAGAVFVLAATVFYSAIAVLRWGEPRW